MDTIVTDVKFPFPYKLNGGKGHRWRVRGLRKSNSSIMTGYWSDEILFFTKEPTHAETAPGIPPGIFLQQNYPNPFNSSTNIMYGLPARAYVSLRLFDVTGRILNTLVATELDAGIHSIVFHPESLASGLYILRLDAVSVDGNLSEQTSITRKLTLVK